MNTVKNKYFLFILGFGVICANAHSPVYFEKEGGCPGACTNITNADECRKAVCTITRTSGVDIQHPCIWFDNSRDNTQKFTACRPAEI